MAKTIGGGFPVGAVGGRREFMRALETDGSVANLGTFSANPMMKHRNGLVNGLRPSLAKSLV